MNKSIEKTEFYEIKGEVLNGILLGGLIVLLIFGFVQVKDYGISFDEATEMNTMLKTYAYSENVLDNLFTNSMFQDPYGYLEYPDNIYGVAVRFPVYLIMKWLKLDFRDSFLLLHYYTYLWFFLAIVALYYLIKHLDYGKTFALIGCLLFCLTPRIFAESTYNIKDCMFLFTFIVAMALGVLFLKKKKIRYAVAFSFFEALAINTRCIGGVLLVLVCILLLVDEFKRDKNAIRPLIRCFSICILTYLWFYLMTPFLWNAPILHSLNIITSFSDYADGAMELLFNGKYYMSNQLPWYYLTEWIMLTTPIVILVLMLIGSINLIFAIIQDKQNNVKTEITKLYEKYLGITFFVILILDAVIRPVKYDGWRHFYFLYAFIILLSVRGAFRIWKRLEKRKTIDKIVSCSVGLIMMLVTLGWMIFAHPYEYVYFNEVARCFEKDNFERDYWYVSTYDAVQDIISTSEQENVKIFCVCKTVMYYLSENDLSRITFVDDWREADYAILQYRDGTIDNLKSLFSEYPEYLEQKVDGIPLYTIYYLQ